MSAKQTQTLTCLPSITCNTENYRVVGENCTHGEYKVVEVSNLTWSHGSVGRAHRSHRWGHRFESCCDHHNLSENVKFSDIFYIVYIF